MYIVFIVYIVYKYTLYNLLYTIYIQYIYIFIYIYYIQFTVCIYYIAYRSYVVNWRKDNYSKKSLPFDFTKLPLFQKIFRIYSVYLNFSQTSDTG